MSEKLINEVIVHHNILQNLLIEERERYPQSLTDNLNEKAQQMEFYLNKLQGLAKEMSKLTNRSKELKKRADHLLMIKQKNDENFALEMERVKKLEQSLRPIKPSSNN